MSTMQTRIKPACLEIFEKANHRVHLEQPEAVVQTIKKFIQTNTLK